jgi:hypothetical protein
MDAVEGRAVRAGAASADRSDAGGGRIQSPLAVVLRPQKSPGREHLADHFAEVQDTWTSLLTPILGPVNTSA